MAEDFGLIKPGVPADKEYLRQSEAAEYCCLSVRQFREVAPKVGLFPFQFGGRLVYRRDDCRKAMEDERWRQSI